MQTLKDEYEVQMVPLGLHLVLDPDVEDLKILCVSQDMNRVIISGTNWERVYQWGDVIKVRYETLRSLRVKRALEQNLDPLPRELERILFRRLMQKRIDGYIIDTAEELAEAARETVEAITYHTT